jgi:UDP-N-acetylmuramoyl-tripeptide--D-alanyl-D-alanine ligase
MFPKLSIDTRSIQPGEIYVAIRGENLDGHNFISQAVALGASGVIIDKDIDTFIIPSEVSIVRVPNCLEYLAEKAKERIAQFSPEIIGITGSVGKTTTKNAVVSVLREAFDVITPKGNLNTLLGVSLSILNDLTRANTKLVVEVGTYQIGNIANFCNWIRPNICLITNVQPVHLERMKTIENIAQAKGELVEAISSQGTACLNWDDFRVREMKSKCKGNIIFYGIAEQALINPSCLTNKIPLLGEYRTYTALAAYSIGFVLGMHKDFILNGLSKIKPEKGRLVILPGKDRISIIDDTYNASLMSTLTAINVLKSQQAKRRIAILGDMFELGIEEEKSHHDVIQYAFANVDKLILVGARMKKYGQVALDSKENKNVSFFDDLKSTIKMLEETTFFQTGDIVLVKGSAGMRMEKIVTILLDESINPAEVLARQEKSWQF